MSETRKGELFCIRLVNLVSVGHASESAVVTVLVIFGIESLSDMQAKHVSFA